MNKITKRITAALPEFPVLLFVVVLGLLLALVAIIGRAVDKAYDKPTSPDLLHRMANDNQELRARGFTDVEITPHGAVRWTRGYQKGWVTPSLPVLESGDAVEFETPNNDQ